MQLEKIYLSGRHPTFKFPREVQLYVYSNQQHSAWMLYLFMNFIESQEVDIFIQSLIFSIKWIEFVKVII